MSTHETYKQNIKLEAWLPKSRNYVDDLRRYFIGGSVKLAEPNYISVPNNFNVNNNYLIFILLVFNVFFFLGKIFKQVWIGSRT